MKIISHSKDYYVEFKEVFSAEEITPSGNYLVVIDRVVHGLKKDGIFNKLNENNVLLFDAVERNKTIESALVICKKMADLGIRRSDTIVSIGGGIVQDVTGFAANIYNRGIKWIYVPTTLLAQCDSCIGGKTSLNYLAYKNILGSFYAPDTIYIHLYFVKTLSEDDYLSGLGEVAKFNIMSAKDGIELLEKNVGRLLQRDILTLDFFVRRSLAFKKVFIEEDEYDYGKRNLLNFAHTFGHAFETVSDYAISHGQAVTLGLLVANNISHARNILDLSLKERMEKICLNFISIKLDEKWFAAENIINAMKKDKKRRTEKIAAVLFASDLSLKVVQDIEPLEVDSALHNLIKMLSNAGKICGGKPHDRFIHP